MNHPKEDREARQHPDLVQLSWGLSVEHKDARNVENVEDYSQYDQAEEGVSVGH